jgi:hypothetical protein
MRYSARLMSEMGLVSRVSPVHTALRNCTRDEGRSFEVGNQVLISSHRKLPRRCHACNPHGAIIALQNPDTALVWLGSWLCENVVVRRADRIDLPSDRYYRREDSEELSISVNQRKIILLVFEFSGFSHSLFNQRT